MARKPIENTDPHDQRLFNRSYLETSMGPQGSAGVRFCVLRQLSINSWFFIY